MAKHTTHLIHRASPLASKEHKYNRYATRAIQHQKPAIAARPNNLARSPGPRSRLHSTNTNRLLATRSQLSTIREEADEAEEDGDGDVRELYRHIESWPQDDAQPATPRKRGRDNDEDVDMLGWDDETTLVAMLQESGSEADEEDELIALAERLKGPMAAQGSVLKQYLRDTVLPAYNSVKAAHEVLDDKVDLAFGAGLLTFDEVCKKVERIALRDEDELKTAHAESQRSVANILQELEQAYGRRMELWAALDEDMNRCATRAASALEALPADVEQAVAALEKKSKAMDKDGGVSANQKLLRGLLEKL